MVMRSAKRGEPNDRARVALEEIRRHSEQKMQRLQVFWGLAEQLREVEAEFGQAAARLYEGGEAMSDMANTSGVHPNRLRRLIDRHGPAAGD